MTRSSQIPHGNFSSIMALQNERGLRWIFGGLPSICCKRRVMVLAGPGHSGKVGYDRVLHPLSKDQHANSNYLTISEWAAERLVFLGVRLWPLAGPLP